MPHDGVRDYWTRQWEMMDSRDAAHRVVGSAEMCRSATTSWADAETTHDE
jgi:hypothetical protein